MSSPAEPYPLQFESDAATGDNDEHDASSGPHDVLQHALEDFEAELSPAQADEFSRTTMDQVKRRILSIQQDQERVKSMIGFSRIQSFLEKIGVFDNLCLQTKIWGDRSSSLSAWIWGPALYIFKTSVEDTKALDSILSAYHMFGNCIPAIKDYEDLILQKPQVVKCLAFMYLDLLRFHQRVVKLLHGKWWRKTFDARWKDYQGDLKTTLVNFETHSEVLEILSDAWQQQRSTEAIIRFDEQSRQFGVSAERVQQLLDHLPVFTDIDARLNSLLTQINEMRQSTTRSSTQDQESSLNTQVWKDIRKQLNDHVMRSVDDRDVLNLIVSMFKRLRENMTKQYSQWEEERKRNQKRDVLSWLATAGTSQAREHEKFYYEVRAPDTGLWVLENHKISSWMNDENPTACLVWLNGKMGAGKTILTSHIIQLCKEIQGFETHYFYCRKHHAKQDTCLAVLKGILWQMAGCNDELLPYCNNKRIEGRQESLDQILVVKQLLEAFCEYDANQFVIIDGLDECELDERKAIVEFWRSMVDKTTLYNPGKLRVFLVSQDVADIRNALKDSMIATALDLHPDDTNQDIRRYLEGKAPAIQEHFQLDEYKKQKLFELIYARAEGMFLYVSLTVENLLQQHNMAFYEDELARNLPVSLADAYAKIIERLKSTLHENSWTVARSILSWLASATRPLKWYELQAALSMQLDSRGIRIDPKHRLRDDIREFDLCGPLVRIVLEEDDMRLEFTHSTARSYIRSGKQSEGLNANAIDYDIAVKCLSYLATDCFHPRLDDAGREKYALGGYYALQDYVAAEWGHHLQQLISHAAPLLEESSREALNATRQLSVALKRFLSFYREIEPDRRMTEASDIDFDRLRGPSSYSRTSSEGFPGSSSQYPTSLGDDEPPARNLYPPPFSGSFSPGRSPTPSGLRSLDPEGDVVDFCEAFKYIPEVYNDLVQLWTHVRGHRRHIDAKEREKLSIPQLRATLKLTRQTIQSLATKPQCELSISTLHGTKLYKCDRVHCDYFFEGLSTAEKLEKHVNRHDRPFHCTVAQCSVAPFGFANKKDCERHVRTYHPEAAAEDGAAFATGNRARASAEDIEGRAKYACPFEDCHKRYTRKANLDAHLDTHNGTRRFACRTCGKAFTRPSDRQRHEKRHMRGRV